MTVLLVLVWPTLIGFLLVRLVGRKLNIPLQLSLGAGLGVGAISCCYFLKLETEIPSILFELSLFAGLSAACWRAGWRRREVRTEGETSRIGGWLSGILAVVLACDVYGFCRSVTDHPHGEWDAWAIWNLHARFLATPYWRDLFSEAIQWTHPDYPLLLSGFIARVWSTLGERNFATPAMVSFLFTFATIGLLGGAVAALKGRTQGLLAALFLAATPYFIGSAAFEYADIPVAFFFLGTLALLTLQDRVWPDQPGLSVLAGICACMAAWTKNEGLLLVALVVPIRAAAMWRWRGARSAAEQLALLAAGLAPVLALLLLFKLTLATSNANFGGRSAAALLSPLVDLHRWRLTALELGKIVGRFGGSSAHAIASSNANLASQPAAATLTNSHRWLVAGMKVGKLIIRISTSPLGAPLMLLAYVLWAGVDWKTDRSSKLTVLATLSMLLAGYFVVCMISPYDIRWQLETAIARLLLQLWPATVFLALLAANRIAFGENASGQWGSGEFAAKSV